MVGHGRSASFARLGALFASFALSCSGGSPIGGECESTGCADGLQCVSDARFPGGYCSALCPDGSCPASSDCDASLGLALCLARCTGDAECRSGYQCFRSHCRPTCTADAQCGADATCGADGRCAGAECSLPADCDAGMTCAGGRCVLPGVDAGMPALPGASCAVDGDCESGRCLPASLGGICATPCTSRDDCFLYTVPAACSAVPTDENDDGTPDTATALCVPLPEPSIPLGSPCGSDAQCAAHLCQDGQCTEVCSDDADCLTGQVCRDLPRAGAGGATYRGCGYRDRVGDVMVDAVTVREGDVSAGFVGLYEVMVPPDAVSVTLQAERVGGDVFSLTFQEVTAPSGQKLYDLTQFFDFADQPLRWYPAYGDAATMLVSNTDRVTFERGQYSWSAGPLIDFEGQTGSARIRMNALIKRTSGGVPVGGAMPLNVFTVGVGVTAANAATDPTIQNMLARFDTILAPAGVRHGTVSYFELTGADATTFQIIDDDDELGGLFSRSAGRSGMALNVFLVRDIASGVGMGSTLGVAGGIPGPVGVHGTENSGVVLAFESIGDAQILGHVLAHEIGHYIGLFHSTEARRACGPGEDPSTADCAPFGGGDVLSDTAYNDQRNLMFWSFVDTSLHQVSNGQRMVFQLNPLVGP